MASKEKDKDTEEIIEETKDENEETVETSAPEEPSEVEVLTKKNEELNDKYLRLFAEFDNYKKRTAKEKQETYLDATAKNVSEILPVLDNFERALATESADEDFKRGVEMIFNQLKDVITKLGVTEIEALGDEFNPEFHYAIKQVEDDTLGENTVCEVFQKGYMLGDKVVRHAMVVVANP